jgi:hypothetical protein
MVLSTRDKGNFALARAVSYFGERSYYLFAPIGHNAGYIDLIVSEDAISLQRVQCKFTATQHSAMRQRYPEKDPVWQVNMQQSGRRRKGEPVRSETVYDTQSFDLLFVSTPGGDYLIQWKKFCEEEGQISTTLILGKKVEKYRISKM